MSTTPSLIPPPKTLFHPLNFPHMLLLGPGPSNCPPRVLYACSMPLIGYFHPKFFEVMDEVKAGIKYAFQTNNEYTFGVSGTGHAAMETAITNVVEDNDKVLICVNGLWGERAAEMAERQGGDVQKIIKSVGANFTLEEITQAVETYKPCVLFICHGESSTGIVQPLEGLGDLCHCHNVILIVDAVASLGAVPIYMDKMGIDILYTGSQKVLSAPPGLSPISFSQKARDKIVSRKTKVRSFYFDMLLIGNYWGCDVSPRRYHHTGPMTNIFAVRESLARLAEESLEKCWDRHQQCARMLHEGIEKMGLKLFIKNKNFRLPTITSVIVPDDVNWKVVSDFVAKKYSIEIAGGLGATAGKIWRIGLMGYNSTRENVQKVLSALQDGIEAARSNHPAHL